jgi:hypothetical protein
MTTKDSIFPEFKEDEPVDEIPNDPRPHSPKKHTSNGGYEEQHRTPPEHQSIAPMYFTVYLITECTIPALFLWFPDAYVVRVFLKLVGIRTHDLTSRISAKTSATTTI